MIAVAILFWTCLAMVAWSYVGYGIFLAVVARFRSRPVAAEPCEPSVSVVIAAYNEEKAIASKIENLLALEYPSEKLQVVVASDGSSDDTGPIVESFAGRGVVLVDLPRSGKTTALNAAAEAATGEVLVFTDATTEFTTETLRTLVEPLADPTVGCVGAELDYVAGATAVGRGTTAYWRYERALKRMESDVCSLIGCSGALYAVRASAYTPMHPELSADFALAGEVFEKGHRVVYGHGAISREEVNPEPKADFRMRVRVVVGTIHSLVVKRALLNPFRYGFFAVQLWSHKVLRYLAPVLLLVALAAHVTLVVDGRSAPMLYRVLLVGHVGVWVAAAAGWVATRTGIRIPLVNIPYYFAHMNAAAVVAIARYIGGDKAITWETER